MIRVLMTFTSVFVNSQKWMSVAELGLSVCLVYLVWYWQPQLNGWVNHVRVGAYTSVCWCSIIFLILAFGLGECKQASKQASKQEQASKQPGHSALLYPAGVDLSDDSATYSWAQRWTTVMWATFVPAGLIGALASYLRLRYFTHYVLTRFRQGSSVRVACVRACMTLLLTCMA